MPEYVYALHDFVPENSDEIAFRAGEAIEVMERDDIYSDGWWQGKNKDGAIGLFPQSYTTPVPPTPPEPVLQPQPAAPEVVIHSPTPLHSLQEEPENISMQGSPNPDAISHINGIDPTQNHEVMKATMTDVQRAIEQLGKSDGDGSRSFSFASSREGDWTDRELDSDRDTEGETDGEGETWHTSARQKLAEKARLANQKKAEEQNTPPPMRLSVPPIEVEMSDESEAEDEEDRHISSPDAGPSFSGNHAHISEEEEGEQKLHIQEVVSIAPAPVAVPEVTPPSPMEEDLPTATVDKPFPRQRSESPNSDYRPGHDLPATNGVSLPTPTSPNTFETTEIAAPTPQGFQDRPSSTSLANSAETRYSLTPVHQNTGLPSPIASSFTSIGQTMTPAASVSPVRSPSALHPESFVSQTPKASSPKPPSEWTVEEVVDWLKSKGFDPPTCDKFIEQEITGDVLLDLNVDLLKTEIGIIAFGKRKRIANLIDDLKRPPSIVESQTMNSESLFTHTRTPSSTHQSWNSPSLFTSPALKDPQMPLPAIMSLDSPPHTGDIVGTPEISKGRSRRGSDPGSVNGSIMGLIRASSRNSIIGLGINVSGKSQKNRPADLAFTPTDSIFNSNTTSSDNVITLGEDERAVVSENEVPGSANSNNKRRRLFGRSLESTSQKDSIKESSSRNSKEVSSPISATSQPDSLEEPGIPPARHRPRRSVDTNKASDRLSLFGNTFSGSLGKNRKPPPRYSSMTSDTEKDKSDKASTHSGTLSRLYHIGDRKASTRRPPTAESALKVKDVTASPGKSKEKDSAETKSRKDKREEKRDSKEAKEKEKKDTFKRDSKEPKDRNSKDQPALLRKRTSSGGDLPHAPVASIAGASGLKPGLSVLEQIGTPDYNGWLHKKGESYNAWKYRYLVLRGSHLYWMRSNDKSETKIKGYLNVSGYKVVPDENIRPGSYGFKMIHDNDKIHYFSSDAQLVVREWMKALMKSTIDRDYTKPVMSSVNIPTIPLTVAQAMSPPPRPPSPGSRAATQKAARPSNPNQLSSRDAQILLMGIVPNADTRENTTERSRIESFFPNEEVPSPIEPPTPTSPRVKAPPRPSREMRRIESGASQSESIDDDLIEWANSHLPPALRIVDITGSICGGLALLRLAESIRGKPSSPSVPDSAFPTGSNDDKLDGLFRLFDFLLDNDVRIGSVSINDVRQGKRDKILQLLKALRAWEDKRRQIAMSVANGSTGPYVTGVGMSWVSM